MSETSGRSHSDDSNTSLHDVLKTCANIPSLESLCQPLDYDYNDVYLGKMISPNPYSISGNISISNSSYASEDSYTENILEDSGRISLAYENLHTIPRRIADKFAGQTKCLDLSHNNFQNLSFLSFFEDLHTLILDRNSNLDVNTLPYLPSLSILWINNCDITNITDWIHRIERQCPSLEHLSVMGNPGIKTVFSVGLQPGNEFNYRDYILQVLPNLKYLDGLPRYALNERPLNGGGNGAASSSCASMGGQESTSASDNPRRALNRVAKATGSPTLSFKDLFRLKPRKKLSANGIGGYANSIGSSTN